MKPPICAICNRRVDGPGGLTKFADYEPLPDGMVGHPRGLVWFCGRHAATAEKLADRSTEDALRSLRRRYWFASWRGLLSRG